MFDGPSLPPALARSAREAAGDPEAALRLAPDVAEALGRPGGGNTLHLWRGLAELGAIDLTVARTLEPDLDARAILDQAGSFGGDPDPETPGRTRDVGTVPGTVGGAGAWGVCAAESPDHRLEANQGGMTAAEGIGRAVDSDRHHPGGDLRETGGTRARWILGIHA